jgi:transcriptional regulator with XRE-family HTH domain
MTFKELREMSGMNQREFGEYFGIPLRTVQNWHGGLRECPAYLLDLMRYKLENEGRLALEETKTAPEEIKAIKAWLSAPDRLAINSTLKRATLGYIEQLENEGIIKTN